MSKEFIVAFSLIVLAMILSIMGAVVIALPLGLIGGFFLIKEMLPKVKSFIGTILNYLHK